MSLTRVKFSLLFSCLIFSSMIVVAREIEIKTGMKKSQVERLLGQPVVNDRQMYDYGSLGTVHFDRNGRVERTTILPKRDKRKSRATNNHGFFRPSQDSELPTSSQLDEIKTLPSSDGSSFAKAIIGSAIILGVANKNGGGASPASTNYRAPIANTSFEQPEIQGPSTSQSFFHPSPTLSRHSRAYGDKKPYSNDSGNRSESAETRTVGSRSYTNFSDGTTAETYSIGNRAYTDVSNGKRAETYSVGNRTYTDVNDGTRAETYSIGKRNYTDYSDGTRAETYSIGNRVYTDFSDGSKAETYKIGNQTYTDFKKK